MRWIKYVSAFLLFPVFVCLFFGCTNSGKEKSLMNVNSTQEKTNNNATVKKSYQRVVSLSVSSDEILLDLLPTENVVGVTSSTLRKELSNCVEKARKVANTVQVNSPESIYKLNPDLVIIPDFVRTEVITTLKDMGMNVYLYRKPLNFEEIKESIKGIAGVIGKDPTPVLGYMTRKEVYLKDRLKGITDKSRKRMVYLMSTGIYCNPNSPFQDICNFAGVKDAAMELNIKNKAHLPKEQMIRLNPDVIIVPDFNWDGKSDTNEKIKAVLEDEAYRNVKAIKNKQVYAINGAHLYSLSHHIIDCSEDIAKAVYPECFK